VRSGFVIPSGDEDQFVWEPNLLGALRVGQGGIYAALGGEIRAGNDATHVFTYTISGAYPWWHLVGVLELGGTLSSEKHELYLAPGLFWNAFDFLQVGLGAPIGLTHAAADFQIVGLFVFEFF